MNPPIRRGEVKQKVGIPLPTFYIEGLPGPRSIFFYESLWIPPNCGVGWYKKKPACWFRRVRLALLCLSSSGAVPDFRQNQITPVVKDDDLNKADNDDDKNTETDHIRNDCNRLHKPFHQSNCPILPRATRLCTIGRCQHKPQSLLS